MVILLNERILTSWATNMSAIPYFGECGILLLFTLLSATYSFNLSLPHIIIFRMKGMQFFINLNELGETKIYVHASD